MYPGQLNFLPRHASNRYDPLRNTAAAMSTRNEFVLASVGPGLQNKIKEPQPNLHWHKRSNNVTAVHKGTKISGADIRPQSGQAPVAAPKGAKGSAFGKASRTVLGHRSRGPVAAYRPPMFSFSTGLKRYDT